MIYQYKDTILDINGSTGYFYSGKQLYFKGDAYKAILMFIKTSNNNENVLKKFNKQLTQREVCRLKKLEKHENE